MSLTASERRMRRQYTAQEHGRVVLRVDHQTFEIDSTGSELSPAWWRDHLAIALARLVEHETDTLAESNLKKAAFLKQKFGGGK